MARTAQQAKSQHLFLKAQEKKLSPDRTMHGEQKKRDEPKLVDKEKETDRMHTAVE